MGRDMCACFSWNEEVGRAQGGTGDTLIFSYIRRLGSFFMPSPFIRGGGGGGGHIASPLSVRPVRTKIGFRAISFEYIGVFSYTGI